MASSIDGAFKERKRKSFEDWEIESAAGTLTEAEKIRGDPKLLRLAQARIKKRVEAGQKALRKPPRGSSSKKGKQKKHPFDL